MKDTANYRKANFSKIRERINNPQTSYNQNGININVLDPESQMMYPDEKYVKEITGGHQLASLSFFTKPTTTLIREVSHQFDQFAYTLIGFGIIDLLIGFCVLSCMCYYYYIINHNPMMCIFLICII